jgi:hypothetical protein
MTGLCEFKGSKRRRCKYCGYRPKHDRDVLRACPARVARRPLGLGDMVAKWLARIGITSASYRRWKVRCGLADACNCAERKEKLNRFGRWLKSLLPAQPAE